MKTVLIAGHEKNISHYRTAFAKTGIKTIALEKTAEDLTIYDGLVLPGGGDISPTLLSTPNKGSKNIEESLDRAQLFLLDAFIRMNKPILGICKGLQLINVYFGGTLIQDLSEDSLKIHNVQNHSDNIHITHASYGTFPEHLYGANPITNSAHHQAVESVGDGLMVAQYSFDFVIEAMYHRHLPILGVQWHPERMCFDFARPDMDDGSLLLSYFKTLL